MPSRAHAEFGTSISLAEALHALESHYPDPPPPEQIQSARALRGGAIVLMVGAFERFVREAIEEHVAPFSSLPPRKPLDQLPDKMQIASVFNSFEHAMHGPRYGAPTGKMNRLDDVRRAAARLVEGVVDAEALGMTEGNVSADTVVRLLKNLGMEDPFGRLRPTFDAEWGKLETQQFLHDKLDSIVSSRHSVAHAASVLSIGRTDVSEGIRFLKALATAVDRLLEAHIAAI